MKEKHGEILLKIEEFANENGYGLTKYADAIAEAKRRMGKHWADCPCHRDGEHYCGSPVCKKEIETKGVCGCNLYTKKQS